MKTLDENFKKSSSQNMKHLFWVVAIVCVLAVSNALHKVTESYDMFLDKLYIQTAKSAYVLGCVEAKVKRPVCEIKAAKYIKALEGIRKIDE